MVALSTSIVTPIVLFNKNNNNAKKDVEKIFKILQAKTSKEKIIELSSNTSVKSLLIIKQKLLKKFKL